MRRLLRCMAFNKMVKWYHEKKPERGMPHMPAPGRGCLDYSKVYYNVRKIWFLAWNQNRHISYYIFHIQYTNSEISIDLLDIHPRWHRLNHCAPLVRNLPSSILVRASVSLLTFHTSIRIRQPFCRHYGLWISRAADSETFPFPHCLVLLTCLALHGQSCRTTSKVLSSSLKKMTSVSINN